MALSLLVIVFFCDEEPNSKLPWACISKLQESLQIIRKLITAICFYITKNNSSIGAGAMCFSLILSLFCLRELFVNIFMQDKKVQYSLMGKELTITWLSFTSLLFIITGVNLGNPVVLAFIIPIFIVAMFLINKANYSKMVKLNYIDKVHEEDEVMTYCRVLLENLSSPNLNNGINLDGMILLHTNNCTLKNCPCKSFSICSEEVNEEHSCDVQKNELSSCIKIPDKTENIILRQEEIGKNINEFIDPNTGEEMNEVEKRKQGTIKIIISEIEKWNSHQEKRPKLRVFIGYLKMGCYKSKLAALYEAMSAEEGNPNFYERYLAYRLM